MSSAKGSSARVGAILFILLIACYLTLAAMANADLTAGRFVLFMDERITFDGVRNILHPDGVGRFLWSIADGGDHRYGRILWNAMAPFSFLPERLFGEAGQICAGRMTQALILVSAFVVLTVSFVKRWPFRLLLMASLLAMPFTSYYMSMPKPEPVQMLCLALFLRGFGRNGMSFKGWHWIFLGLAFGAKISTLPVLAVFGGAATLSYFPGFAMRRYLPELLRAISFFLAGLALAVPILLPSIAIAVIFFAALDWLFTRRLPRYGWQGRLALAAGSALLTVGNAALLRASGKTTGMAVWVGSTFLNTGHGDDSSAINFRSWVDYFFHHWMVAPATVAALFAVAALALAAAVAARLPRRDVGVLSLPEPYLPLVVTLAGGILDLAIFSGVHRLWGFYLFPGSVLAIVGVVAIMESAVTGEGTFAKERSTTASAVAATVLLCAVVAGWWLPHSVAEYRTLAMRTKTPEYRRDYASYLEVTRFLARHARERGKSLTVSYDPALFLPASNAQCRITECWSVTPEWNGGFDVIVLGVGHTPNRAPVSADAPSYPQYRKERELYDANVVCPPGDDAQGKGYRRCLRLPNGGEILIPVRRDGNGISS